MFSIYDRMVEKMKRLYYLYNTSNKALVNSRIKKAILLMIFLIALILLFDAISAFGSEKAYDTNHDKICIEVQAGDTLTDIAKLYAPQNTDIYEYINLLMEVNDLESSELFVGQKLIIRSDYM